MKQLTLLTVLALLPLLAAADAVKIGGLYYNLDSKAKTAEVTNMPSGNYSGAVEIPTGVSYDGIAYSVTSIGDGAFNKCTDLTSIKIPNSVTNIGGYAFWGCDGLTSVTIPGSVKSMGYNIFWRCAGLISVTISDGVTVISEQGILGLFQLDHGQDSRHGEEDRKQCFRKLPETGRRDLLGSIRDSTGVWR